MISEINLLFVISLAFVSWVLLCYIHYFMGCQDSNLHEDMDTKPEFVEESLTHAPDVAPIENRFSAYFNYCFIFICLFILTRIIYLIELHQSENEQSEELQSATLDNKQSSDNTNEDRQILTVQEMNLQNDILCLEVELKLEKEKKRSLNNRPTRGHAFLRTQLRGHRNINFMNNYISNLFDDLPRVRRKFSRISRPNILTVKRNKRSHQQLHIDDDEKLWNMNYKEIEKPIQEPNIPGILDLPYPINSTVNENQSILHTNNDENNVHPPTIYLSNASYYMNRNYSTNNLNIHQFDDDISNYSDDSNGVDSNAIINNYNHFNETHFFSKTEMMVPLPKKVLHTGNKYQVVDMDDAEAIIKIVRELHSYDSS